jgi:hypothetical protein
MLKAYKSVLAITICAFFFAGCATKKINTNHSVMQIQQSADGQVSLDAFKTNLPQVFAKYGIDPKYVTTKAGSGAGLLEYYFHTDYPMLLQAFSETASIPVVKSGVDGVTLKIVAGVGDPACNGSSTCQRYTFCGTNPPACYKKDSCTTLCGQ